MRTVSGRTVDSAFIAEIIGSDQGENTGSRLGQESENSEDIWVDNDLKSGFDEKKTITGKTKRALNDLSNSDEMLVLRDKSDEAKEVIDSVKNEVAGEAKDLVAEAFGEQTVGTASALL